MDRHHVPGAADEVEYSIEFFDMTGSTVAAVIVPASQLRLPLAAVLPAVRKFAKSPE